MPVTESVRLDRAEPAVGVLDAQPATIDVEFDALAAPRRWHRVTATPALAGPPAAPTADHLLVPDAGPPVPPSVASPAADRIRAALTGGDTPRPRPPWIDGTAWQAEDHAVLRRALDGRYDAHARVVTSLLAREPGLRAAMLASADLPAALVAVRAYRAGDQAAVNAFLRGERPAEPASEVAVLARCAAYGLRRLPAVLGPVFRAGAVAPGDAAPPGTELVEPGLVDVDLVSTAGPETAVEFVIWSVGAARLGDLASGDGGVAVLPPATRFEVLAVDEPTELAPCRVLLREIPRAGEPTAARSPAAARPSAEIAERIRQRLRAAGTAGAGIGPGAPNAHRPGTGGYPESPSPGRAPLAAVPGLDSAGRPYLVERKSSDGRWRK